MKKRLIALLLLVASLLILLASCDVADGIGNAGSETGTRAETAGENVADVGTETENDADETGSGTTPSTPGQTTAATTKAGTPASTKATTAATTRATTAATTAKPEIPQMQSAVKEPKAGDDPAKLSGIENVMRIAWVLQHAENYSVEASGTVTAKVVITYTQDVKTYKDYSRGVLVQIDITKSDSIFINKNSAWQTCFKGDNVLIRKPSSSDTSSWNGRKTAWKTDAPSSYTRTNYRSSYGLFGFELTNYLLNESTVTEWSAVTKNSDGTYTQTIKPNVSTATSDIACRMKTMGDLSSTPTFSNISIKLTFDGNWRILSMHVEETYNAKSGNITAKNTKAVTDLTYSYGKADMSAYDNFFAAQFK